MAIIGAILGDIAGSKWEFNRPKNLDYEHIELFQDDSYYTDDTVLSVATKYALENEVCHMCESHSENIILWHI